MMVELVPEEAALSFKLHIKRKETGLVETYDVIGTPVKETEEKQNGSDAPHSSS